MKATYAAAGVITFMNAWNSYLLAEGNYDNSGFTDDADADCESFGRLYDGLWGF